MKIIVEMITYNGMPLLEAALKSSLPFVDEVVLVDGSAYGPSTDGTVELVNSLGPKIRYIRGTYQVNGHWDEASQRKAALDVMERADDNWLLFQDGDEVWEGEQLLKLTRYLEVQPLDVCYCTFQWKNFWLNPHQTIRGGCFDVRRPDMVSRLGVSNRTPWEAPRTDFPDVFFYHYSHALPKEKRDWKLREYFARGDYKKHLTMGLVQGEGWNEDDFEKFHQWHDKNWYGSSIPGTIIEPFMRQHHPEVRRISSLIWGEQL